jgi:hypothetical protein
MLEDNSRAALCRPCSYQISNLLLQQRITSVVVVLAHYKYKYLIAPAHARKVAVV